MFRQIRASCMSQREKEDTTDDEALDDDVCETRGLVEQNGTLYAAVPADVADDLDLEHKGRCVWSGSEGSESVTMRSNRAAMESLDD